MKEVDLIAACLRNDKDSIKQFFKLFYGKFALIALRYSKNKNQSEELLSKGFIGIFNALPKFKNQSILSLEDFSRQIFISVIIKEIKSIRNEYYLSSTVKITENDIKSYDLIVDVIPLDLTLINQTLLLQVLHELVPSQRLAFNLNVIEGLTLSEISEILETSEQTIKSNLEKARFNFQKSIEKNLKLNYNEQTI